MPIDLLKQSKQPVDLLEQPNQSKPLTQADFDLLNEKMKTVINKVKAKNLLASIPMQTGVKEMTIPPRDAKQPVDLLKQASNNISIPQEKQVKKFVLPTPYKNIESYLFVGNDNIKATQKEYNKQLINLDNLSAELDILKRKSNIDEYNKKIEPYNLQRNKTQNAFKNYQDESANFNLGIEEYNKKFEPKFKETISPITGKETAIPLGYAYKEGLQAGLKPVSKLFEGVKKFFTEALPSVIKPVETEYRVPFTPKKVRIVEPRMLSIPAKIAGRLLEVIPRVAIDVMAANKAKKEIIGQGLIPYQPARLIGKEPTSYKLPFGINAKRFGFEESEVKDFLTRGVEKYEKLNQESPNTRELNAIQGALEPIGFAFDAIAATDIATGALKFTLKQTGYNPYIDNTLKKFDLDRNTFSVENLKENAFDRAVDTVQKYYNQPGLVDLQNIPVPPELVKELNQIGNEMDVILHAAGMDKIQPLSKLGQIIQDVSKTLLTKYSDVRLPFTIGLTTEEVGYPVVQDNATNARGIYETVKEQAAQAGQAIAKSPFAGGIKTGATAIGAEVGNELQTLGTQAYYHTTPTKNVSLIEQKGFSGDIDKQSQATGGKMEKGVFLYPEKESADFFKGNFEEASVIETRVQGKIYDTNTQNKYGWEDDLQITEIAKDKNIIDQLRKDGFVGIQSTEIGTNVVFIFEPSTIKTKSQLTSMQNKTNAPATPPTFAPEAGLGVKPTTITPIPFQPSKTMPISRRLLQPIESSKMADLEYRRHLEQQEKTLKRYEEEEKILQARESKIIFDNQEQQNGFEKFKELAKTRKWMIDDATFEMTLKKKLNINVDNELFAGADEITNNDLLEKFKEKMQLEKEIINLAKQKTPTELELKQKNAIELEVRKQEIGKKSIQQQLKQKSADFISKRETTLLKDKIRNMAKGYREGRTLTKQEIQATQEEIIDAIQPLEAKDKAKFIAKIKNIQSNEQLQKAMPDIQEKVLQLEDVKIKREVFNKIQEELKFEKIIEKQSQKIIGKYDYETNKFFSELKNLNKLNQEMAKIELDKPPKENLSNFDLIKTRFLSMKANGLKSSAALIDRVAGDIQMLKEYGADAKSEIDFQKELEKTKRIDEVIKAIEEQKLTRSIFKKPKELYISSVSNLYSALNTIAGKDMADKYDYANFKTNSQYNANNKIKIGVEKFKEIYDVKSNKELEKIFIKDLAPMNWEITDNTGLKQEINKFDLINIYNGIKNDLIKERYDNAFGLTQINDLLQNLTEEDIKIADFMMDEVQEYKEILNKRNIEITGRDMGTVENYWPSVSEHQVDFFDDIKLQGETPSALKERSKSSKVIPKKANAWSLYNKHIHQAEHIKLVSQKYEELKRIFTDRQVRIRIENKFGDKIYETLMSHIETMSLNQATEIMDVFSGMYNKALNTWVKAKINSPTVFVRQLIGSTYSIENVGIQNYIKYNKDFIANPKKTFDFMWKNIPYVQSRFTEGYNEALEDVIRGTKEFNVGMSDITKYLSFLTRSGDIISIMINGYPIIKTELAKHGNMEKAIEVFENFTEKTQQSGTSTNLSNIQRQNNPFARTFFRFKNSTNQLLRLQVDANIQFINGQISGEDFLKKTVLYSIYTPIMYVLTGALIVGGYKKLFGKEEDNTKNLPGNILQNIIIQPFQALPFLDAAIEIAYSEARKRITGKDYYLGEGVFSFPLLDDISKAWSKATKKEPTTQDWLQVMSILQEPVTGLPTETILRYYKYATEEEKSKLKIKSPLKSNRLKLNKLKIKPKLKLKLKSK